MATHSSTLAWKIHWMEEPGRLQSMGSRRVGHDWWLHFHFSLSFIGEGNAKSLHCSCLENPRDGRAWWAAVYGVAQNRTWLKWLSSSSSKSYCEYRRRRWGFSGGSDSKESASSARDLSLIPGSGRSLEGNGQEEDGVHIFLKIVWSRLLLFMEHSLSRESRLKYIYTCNLPHR